MNDKEHLAEAMRLIETALYQHVTQTGIEGKAELVDAIEATLREVAQAKREAAESVSM